MQLLIFTIQEQKYALELRQVERVLLALQYTPIPNASEYVLGIINFHGMIIPVINTRKLLSHNPKQIEPEDRIILCHAQNRLIALLVDHVEIANVSKNASPSTPSAIQCVLKEEEMTLLCDLEKLIPKQLLPSGSP